MSQTEGEEDTPQHELVIIRRRGDGDDVPHKGGVWKIAHADFMTALMAFFLVMWLINATDEQTVSGVANYFNPMRLSDSSTKPKGLFNMDPGASEEGDKEGEADKHAKSKAKKADAKRKSAEAAMLSEPYEALDKIAAEAGKTPPALALTERGSTPAHKTGEAFRDPFDPDLRYAAPHAGEPGGRGGEKDANATAGKGNADGGDAPGAYPAIDNAAEKARADVMRRIEEAVRQSGLAAIPGIEVRATGEGILINITDQSNFEMFNLSSARPTPELVVLMEKLGKVILARPEQVVIRGHTDARPFRSGDYDNWRLSTARAHMAYYMLTRGGVPDKRFDRIEGRADHDPRIAGEPLAPANRRIEVLLLKGRT